MNSFVKRNEIHYSTIIDASAQMLHLDEVTGAVPISLPLGQSLDVTSGTGLTVYGTAQNTNILPPGTLLVNDSSTAWHEMMFYVNNKIGIYGQVDQSGTYQVRVAVGNGGIISDMSAFDMPRYITVDTDGIVEASYDDLYVQGIQLKKLTGADTCGNIWVRSMTV